MRNFRIHDNGDRPFRVKEINKHIFVFNQEDNYKKDNPIFETDYEQLWVGSKSKFQQPENVSIHANQESDYGLSINNHNFELWYYEILIVGKLWVNVKNVLNNQSSIRKD